MTVTFAASRASIPLFGQNSPTPLVGYGATAEEATANAIKNWERAYGDAPYEVDPAEEVPQRQRSAMSGDSEKYRARVHSPKDN